jgi:hypothetical protein
MFLRQSKFFAHVPSGIPAAGRGAPLRIHESHVNLAAPYPNRRTNDMRRPVSACLAGLAALALAKPAAAQMTLMAYAGIFRDNNTAVVVAPFGGQVQWAEGGTGAQMLGAGQHAAAPRAGAAA